MRKIDTASNWRHILSLAALMIAASISHAASSFTWDGGAINNSWSSSANWAPDGSPASGGSTTTDIHFAGSTRTTPNNNLGTGGGTKLFTLNNLFFDSGAASFTLSGDTLVFNGTSPTITQNSANAQSIGEAITLNTQTTVAGTGSGQLTISSVVSGAGQLSKSSGGNLVLSAANDYSGVTAISGGSVILQNNSSLGTTAGGTTVASGSSIQVSGVALTIAEPITSLVGSGPSGNGALQNVAGNNTWSGAITLGAAARINADSGTTLTLSGGITASPSGSALTLGGQGTINVTSTAIGSSVGGVTKDGPGTLNLNVANSYTSGTTLTAGTLAVGAANALPANGGISVASGTILSVNNVAAGSVGALTLSGAGDWTLQLSPGGASGSIHFGNITYPGSGTFKVTGWTGAFGQSGTDDHIYLDGTIPAGFFSHVQFYSDVAGTIPIGEGFQPILIAGNELVPVPEPINIALGVFGAVFVGGHLIRRSMKKNAVRPFPSSPA